MRMLTLGGSGGALQLSPETVELVFEQQADGVDLVLMARAGSASATA